MGDVKHTPGPWVAAPFKGTGVIVNQLIQAPEYDVATCHAYSKGTEAEALANAHLIAAAPTLLEELVWLVDQMDRLGGVTIDSGSTKTRLRSIRAAIALAKGENVDG